MVRPNPRKKTGLAGVPRYEIEIRGGLDIVKYDPK
jgi:hypothetical protein